MCSETFIEAIRATIGTQGYVLVRVLESDGHHTVAPELPAKVTLLSQPLHSGSAALQSDLWRTNVLAPATFG